jgi:CRISPR-associated protein Csb2
MRVASNTKGTLNRLKAAFETPPYRPSIQTWQGYAQQVNAGAEPGHTIFDERIEILQLEPAESTAFRALQLETTLALTSTLREAILKRCSEPIPESISGHAGDNSPSAQPHMALMPLPFVGRDFADGHLLGVAVALPRGMEKTAERQLLATLDALADVGEQEGHGLGFDGKRFPGLGQWRLIRQGPFDEFRTNLRAETWTAGPHGCTHWGSVTPVVFDQHAKAKNKAAYLDECSALAEEAVHRVVQGDVKVTVRVMPVSLFSGVPSANSFPRLKRKDGSLRRHVHVELLFDRPVMGPLLIGAGRFRGYGLCRPLWEDK